MESKADKPIIVDYGDFRSVIICLVLAATATAIIGAQSGYIKSSLIWFGAVGIWYVFYCEKYSFYEDHMTIKSKWRSMQILYSDILKINKSYVRYAYNLILKENMKVGILHSDLFNDLERERAVERIRQHVEHNNSFQRTSR